MVTITTGGNDIGFVGFVECIVNNFNPSPACSPSDPRIQATYANLATVGAKVSSVIAAGGLLVSGV